MNLKTYQAASMSDALADVKRDLGRDAVILHTRSFRKGGFLGIGGRPMWEITASPNINVPSRGNRGLYMPTRHDQADTLVTQADRLVETMEAQAADTAATPVIPDDGESNGFLRQQMSELRRMVESLVARQSSKSADGDTPAELERFRAHLLAQDVGDEVAAELIGQLKLNLTGQQLSDSDRIKHNLHKLIVSLIGVAAPAEPKPNGHARVMALIGPTGVGKTTTIAKLAANFKIRQHKKVGLITIDTYRIAAVDQLRTYAEIIDIPLQTVLTAGELHQMVHSMRDMDIVLIDTAGRSQNDRLRLNQLRGFLNACGADEVHLVVSSTANRQCVNNTLERFIPLGVNRIIVTKLDEAATFGSILNVASAGKVAISYVTAGQDVPEDIFSADAGRLASWIVNGSMGEGSYAS